MKQYPLPEQTAGRPTKHDRRRGSKARTAVAGVVASASLLASCVNGAGSESSSKVPTGTTSPAPEVKYEGRRGREYQEAILSEASDALKLQEERIIAEYRRVSAMTDEERAQANKTAFEVPFKGTLQIIVGDADFESAEPGAAERLVLTYLPVRNGKETTDETKWLFSVGVETSGEQGPGVELAVWGQGKEYTDARLAIPGLRFEFPASDADKVKSPDLENFQYYLGQLNSAVSASITA